MYQMVVFDMVNGKWNYLNTFDTYGEACAALEKVQRQHPNWAVKINGQKRGDKNAWLRFHSHL